MSDAPSPEQQRDIEEAHAAHDQRVAFILQSLDIEEELRKSKTLTFILHMVDLEKEAVFDEFAETEDRNPTKLNHLQARAMMCKRFRQWLSDMFAESRALEEELAIEDGQVPADE